MPWAFLFFAESFGMSISVGMCCSAIATNGLAMRSAGIESTLLSAYQYVC
jgi:hypothetical protein